MRTDDAFEVRERDSAAVVTYLPVAVALFALPLYLLTQATLFWRVMRQVPGVLAGTGWGDAWRLSVDNLLLTELFLDAFDVFGFGLAEDPPGLAGRLLVFATRLVLSVGFVRLALSLVRAAYYRAHGLGRGTDVLAELRSAAEEGDAVRVGHLGRQVRDGATGTIDVLVARLERPDASPEERRDAYRCLRALRDWAIPYFDGCLLHGDPRAPALARLVVDLRDAWAGPALEPPRPRPAIAAVLALAAVAVAALVAWAPPALAFAFGTASMLVLLWLLASPRAAYEAAMERGLAPYVPLERLRGAILWSSALAAVAYLLASWATLGHASALWPGAFEAPGGDVDAALASGSWPPPARVHALARRASVAVRDLDPGRAAALLVEARGLLPANPTPDDAAGFEAAAAWALSVARSVAATRAAAAADLLPLLPRAAEALEHLARQAPERFAVDALRFGIVRAVAVGAAGDPKEGAALLEAAADAALALSRHHPWRETVLLQAVVAASALAAFATDGEEPGAAAALEARLLAALGPDAARWRVEDLAVRAYDEQLGEELAHSGMAVGHLPASEAQVRTARRTAAVFEARFGAGVGVARSYAILFWWFAATRAHALRAHATVLEASEAVVRLAAGLSDDRETEHMVADAHAVRAQALRALGDEEAAFGHAATARAAYARLGASDWADAPAVVAQGAAYLEGFEPAAS